MSQPTIEVMTTAAQIDDVLAVEEASFLNPWTRAMYLAELENPGVSFCYLARDNAGRAIGFCSFWLVADELHINNLAVIPEQRGRGARREARDARSAALERGGETAVRTLRVCRRRGAQGLLQQASGRRLGTVARVADIAAADRPADLESTRGLVVRSRQPSRSSCSRTNLPIVRESPAQ
jgi:GNAT superfamily N-acetyltransferase